MSGGGGESSDTSWKPSQSGAFSTYTSAAENQAYNEGGFYDPQYAGGEDSYAQWSPEQQQLFDRLSGAGGASDQALGVLEQNLGEYDPNNQALTATIDSLGSDIQRNFAENDKQMIQDAAGQAGQYGSTRHGIAEGVAARGAQEQFVDQAGQMRLADYQNYQNNQQDSMNNLASITSGIGGVVGADTQERQAVIDDQLTRWEYETGVPRENLLTMRDLLAIDMGGSGEQATSGGK